MLVIPYSITLGINVAWSSVLDINLELLINQVLFLTYSFLSLLFCFKILCCYLSDILKDNVGSDICVFLPYFQSEVTDMNTNFFA